MRRKIPTTAAMMAFDAAARHESFTRAADELALTQSAVCRQIATLEDFLGVNLFRRTRRGVRLTEAGRTYSRQIAAGLDAVERDTLAVMASQGDGTRVELAVVPTFATRWLLPRLSGFHARHDNVVVNMRTRTRPFLFDDTDFDAAIYFGDGGWPGTTAHYLMPENAVPVCSRQLLDGEAELEPKAIATLPLLQQSTRPYAWRQWFGAQGLQVGGDMAGPRLELFSMLAEAAMHHMGVALIPPFLIHEELDSGRLVTACQRSHHSGRAYYLIIPDHKAETPSLAGFRDWLEDTASAYCTRAGLPHAPTDGAPADAISA